MAHRNWVKGMGRQWLPLSLLPSNMPEALLLTNEDKTKMWVREKPTRRNLDDVDQVHLRGDNEQFMFDENNEPRCEEQKVKAAYWSLVEFV